MIAELHAGGEALLGEGPVWLGETAQLWWVDLLRGEVLRADEAHEHPIGVAQFAPSTTSALIPLGDGTIAVALRKDIAAIDQTGVESAERLVDLVPPGLRFSDGCAGPSGHLWLGVVRDEGSTGVGYLLRCGRDGAQIVRAGIGFANGIGFSVDGETLFVVDSDAGTISAIEHDPSTGALEGEHVFFTLAPRRGSLDGLAVDEHDRVWVAVFGGGAVLCIDRAGVIVAMVDVPARRPTSCAFGRGDTLYITTARVEADDEELNSTPEAGSVFRCSTGIAGAPTWKGRPWT